MMMTLGLGSFFDAAGVLLRVSLLDGFSRCILS